MKSYARALVAILIPFGSFCYAGEVVDLGKVSKVPNWAIGPLLILPMERVEEGRLIAEREETKRLGTVQVNYAEIGGERLDLEEIHLSEVPNDAHRCMITTKPKNGHYFKIHLSQRLFDQTFYFVYLEKFKLGEEKALEANQFAVWDIKSRK
ncbi:MAG: hypothetical protein V4727_08705 [Verrucomicrobiota bacterium]